MATQAITFECVKWRRPPRTSQMPSSGRCHAVSMNSSSSAVGAPAASRRWQPHASAPRRCTTAPRRRRRAGTARRPRCRRAPASSPRSRAARGARTPSGDARPSMSYMICRSAGIARDRAQQPVAKRARLVDVAADHEARPGSGSRRAASRSDSPSCARRRSPRAATSSAPPRCRRWARRSSPSASAASARPRRATRPGRCSGPPSPARTLRRRQRLSTSPPAGGCSCDGNQVSCNGMRSPFRTCSVRRHAPLVLRQRQRAAQDRARPGPAMNMRPVARSSRSSGASAP